MVVVVAMIFPPFPEQAPEWLPQVAASAGGMAPHTSVPAKLNPVVSAVRLANEFGIEPDRCASAFKFSDVSFVRLPRELGRVPLMAALLLRLKEVSNVREPKELGILPDNPVKPKVRYVRFTRLPIESGSTAPAPIEEGVVPSLAGMPVMEPLPSQR